MVVPVLEAGTGRLVDWGRRVYSCGHLLVSPPPETDLILLFLKLQAQNLLPAIFYECPGEVSMRWFLNEMARPGVSAVGCYAPSANPREHEMVGLGWLGEPVHVGRLLTKAECSMAFVRERPPEESLAFGRMMITWSFDNLCLDTIVGTTPAENRAALAYGRRLGMRLAGPIEGFTVWQGKPCAVYIQSMIRERYRSLNWWGDHGRGTENQTVRGHCCTAAG